MSSVDCLSNKGISLGRRDLPSFVVPRYTELLQLFDDQIHHTLSYADGIILLTVGNHVFCLRPDIRMVGMSKRDLPQDSYRSFHSLDIAGDLQLQTILREVIPATTQQRT